jgi:LPXTG-motif cell wall-anchored protein
MNLSKKLLTLLAIFCVIASAGVVCAADNDGGYVGIDYVDDMGDYAGSQYDDGGWAGSQYNETAENAAANQTAPAAGEPTGTTNMTANATSSHTMLATGNPILILLGVSAVLGGAAVLRRKN